MLLWDCCQALWFWLRLHCLVAGHFITKARKKHAEVTLFVCQPKHGTILLWAQLMAGSQQKYQVDIETKTGLSIQMQLPWNKSTQSEDVHST